MGEDAHGELRKCVLGPQVAVVLIARPRGNQPTRPAMWCELSAGKAPVTRRRDEGVPVALDSPAQFSMLGVTAFCAASPSLDAGS